jgi:hypothetical protein
MKPGLIGYCKEESFSEMQEEIIIAIATHLSHALQEIEIMMEELTLPGGAS